MDLRIIWLFLAFTTLLHGPSAAPCTFGALATVLALWAFAKVCRSLQLDPGGERAVEQMLSKFYTGVTITFFWVWADLGEFRI